jgi:ubiquinone/menaquinone biosynthesis C-methylase UbiE
MPTIEEIWRKYDSDEVRLTAPVSERMLDLAGIRASMNVLDLATGRGEPAVRAAHRVGPSGHVLGVDREEAMLRMARERADQEGVTNLELRQGDIEILDGVQTSHFDAVLARWCLMYLASPVAALKATYKTLRPGGVLVAAVWAEPERVSYVSFPRNVLSKYADLPPIDLDVPSTFYYADENRLRHDFESAGLTVTGTEEHYTPVMEAASGKELIAWTRAFGMNRLLEQLSTSIQKSWEADLVREAEPGRTDNVYRLGGVTRLIAARRD